MATADPEDQRSTEGMADYNRGSAMQQELVRYHAERISDLACRLGLLRPELRLADYGCGPGQSAIEGVAPALKAYRALFPDIPISVRHADQPHNDWNSLFELIEGPTGYRDVPDVRTEAAIGSFYEAMAPNGSVDGATCFMASQWLQHAVHLTAPGSVWFADLEGEARSQLEARALEDWALFLKMRAREVRSGGYLLVSALGAVPDDNEPNGIAASGHGVYRAIQTIAQAMVDDGMLQQSVLDSFVFGVWFLTEHEARQPLESDPHLAEAFEIEELTVVPAPHNPTDVFGDFVENPVEYADLYVRYIRGFGDSTLRTQLFEPCAAEGLDADQLADEFYRRLDDLYRANPGQYPGQNWYLTIVLRKI